MIRELMGWDFNVGFMDYGTRLSLVLGVDCQLTLGFHKGPFWSVTALCRFARQGIVDGMTILSMITGESIEN